MGCAAKARKWSRTFRIERRRMERGYERGMAMSALRWVAIVVLIVLGIYMAVFHADPLPANHEALGLGKNHIAHAVVGLVLLAAAAYVRYSGRGKAAEKPAP